MKLYASTDDFIRTFEDNLSKNTTYKAAYEATEQEHERLTGHRKYLDYQSFQVVRSRKRKNKQR